MFGDVALAIGPNFKTYFDVVIATLNQASATTVDKVSTCIMIKKRNLVPRFYLLLSLSLRRDGLERTLGTRLVLGNANWYSVNRHYCLTKTCNTRSKRRDQYLRPNVELFMRRSKMSELSS